MGRRRSRRRDEEKEEDNVSTFTGTAATGWHMLRVEGYSKTGGLGIGRRVKSCPFVVGGHTWCIAYFPDGLTEDTADCVSFALRLERRAAGRDDVAVRAMFSLLDFSGGPALPSFAVPCGVWTFSRAGESWSIARFMERKEFESCYVKHDGFCIRCDVTVLSSSAASAAPPPSPDLRRHLGDFLASGDGADVTLEVGGEAFPAHRSMLAARSPVFKAVFFGGPHKEKGAASVSIDGIEPSVFRALLHFIYTDSLPEIEEGERTAMAQHLLVAADRYGMERLKSICEYFLGTYMEESAVVTTLVIAEQHGCHRLKETWLEVLKSSADYKKLVVGEGFEYLASSCPSLVQELRGGEIFENVDLELEQQDCLDPSITFETLFGS